MQHNIKYLKICYETHFGFSVVSKMTKCIDYFLKMSYTTRVACQGMSNNLVILVFMVRPYVKFP